MRFIQGINIQIARMEKIKNILISFILLITISSYTQDADYHKNRRDAIRQEMQEGVALIYASGRNSELNPNFFYLTGLTDTTMILMLDPE